LQPTIEKIDSLYIDFYPYSLLTNIQASSGLKKLIINVGLSDSFNFRGIASGIPNIDEIVSLHPEGPAISSKTTGF
ncbi:hypothetical protein DSO57_1036346, partial [Entomophthora muscae]